MPLEQGGTGLTGFVLGPKYIATAVQTQEFTVEDAERIVACVNAMDGIENPEEWVVAAKCLFELRRFHNLAESEEPLERDDREDKEQDQ
jgi:hypothetical protein